MLALEGGAAIEEVEGGFAVLPFVADVVDLGVEAEVAGCRGGGLGEVVAAEDDLPVRALEGWVGDLGGFYAVWTGEECRDGGREGGGGAELCEQRVARGGGGAVGECGAGADRVGIGGGDVGDEQGALMARRGCELGEASALDGGEVFAQGVHLGDGQAGADQGAVEGGEVFEGDLEIEGALGHGGGSSADEEEDGGARGDAAQEGEGGVGGAEGVCVGSGMRAAVEGGVGEGIGWWLGGDDDAVAAELREAVEGLVRGLVHGDGGLADGEDSGSDRGRRGGWSGRRE
jgi:hypothetical protein